MSHPGQLEGCYVVTGSSSGIGQAVARSIAQRGGRVVVHGSCNHVGAEQTAAEINGQGGQACVIMADIARQDDRQRLVADAFEYAREDLRGWIHCAGADVLTGRWAEASFADKLQHLWLIDVQGTISLAREVCERWQKVSENSAIANASMVFMGWDQAQGGMEGDAGQMFGTVKGAVMSYSLALAQTVAPRIRVNCVAPGWIRTKWGAEASAYWSARATANALMARWGTPEDVAAAVVYLVGPDAGFVTGQILCVNGGWNRCYHQ